MTVLVIGAAGFLGSHLVDRLLDEGQAVVGLDNLMTGDLANLTEAFTHPRFHFQVGDVREPISVHAELVFNLACPASPVHYQRDPYATLTSSVLGAQQLVDLVRGRSCRVVHASTSEVYGSPGPEHHPQRESYWGHVNSLGPRACYNEGKRAAETLLSDARRRWGADVRIVRLFNTYGPRMALADGRVVSNFVVQALQGEPLTIHGDGEQTRSFCFVDDMMEALLRTSQVPKWSGPVNLGNPLECSVRELANRVMVAVRSSSWAPRIQYRQVAALEDDPPRRCPDITRARELLEFEPQCSLDEGLRYTIDDFRRRLGLGGAL